MKRLCRRKNVAWGFVAVLLVTCGVGTVDAQSRRRDRDKVDLSKLPPANVEGSVQGIARGQILVGDGEQIHCLVRLAPQVTAVTVEGTGSAEMLVPGRFVSFVGDMDARGNVTTDVEEMTLFVPTQQMRPGRFSQGDDPTSTEGPFLVRGQIRSLKRGKMTVDVLGNAVKLELKEAPEVKLSIDDYSLAQQGDAITVRGRWAQKAENGNPGEVFAESVWIELANPVGGDDDDKKRRSRRGRRSESPDEE